MEGVPLSDYLIREVRKLAERPTVDEMRVRLASREPVSPRIDPTALLRAERDKR